MVSPDQNMDPKAQNANFPNHLDPKLKEAYERVMGTATKPAQAAASGAVSTPSPAQPMTPPVTPPAAAPVSPAVAPAQPAAPAASYQVQSLQPAASPITASPAPQTPFVKSPGKSVAKAAVSEKKSSPVMTVLLFFGGIIFFLAYAIVCVKLLNFQLPFPLPF
jgi:hypothetical protein